MNSRQKIVQQQFLNNEAAIIQRLELVYGQALKDIGSKIQGDYVAIQQITDMIDQLDPDDPKRVILESMRQSKVYQKTYQEALQKQVSNVLGAMQLAQYDNVSDYLRECYDGGFLGAMYDLHGQGIPIITPINQQKLIHAVQLDSKISQGLYTRLGQDVTRLKQWITSEVSRCAVTGTSWARCAEILNNRAQIGYHNAVRIARTEGHRIQCAAAMDALDDAKEAGADVVKQWDATLDGDTRESHRAVDGQIRELDEPFSNGLQYPGDPAGGAAEVINCRCALLQRARWAMDQAELDTLKDRAAQHELWSDDPETLRKIKEQSFDDFKQKYLAASEVIPEADPGGIMKWQPDHSCELARKFGTDHYDAMHQMVVDCPDETAAEVWKKYEAQIKVADPNYTGHEKCVGQSLFVNGARDAAGNSFQNPYQVSFHEAGHAIDDICRMEASGGGWHYSARYKDSLFPQTIEAEVKAWVDRYDRELKAAFKVHGKDVEWLHDHGFMSEWLYGNYRYDPELFEGMKYRKAYAYSAVEKEILGIGSKKAMADLSDIVEGASGAKIQCGFGHGATYWRDRKYMGVNDGLATEAFAEMIDSTFASPESLETIKKYLPKSYAVFQEMLAALL